MQVLHKLLLLHVLTYLGQNALGAKIINGVKAPEDSMRFMASLQTRDGHNCGGSLIRDDFVLSAAHCDNDKLVKVVLGTHDLRKTGTVRKIVQICKHPDYLNDSIEHDIMLLKLSHSVSVCGTIRRIQLPPPDMNLQPNQMCRAAGWGETESGRGVPDLRMVGVSVVDQDVCSLQWSSAEYDLPANVICAGGYRTFKGVCFGDSGGPLVCNGMVAGIPSGVDDYCNDPNRANLYTDVSKYRPWIDQILEENGC